MFTDLTKTYLEIIYGFNRASHNDTRTWLAPRWSDLSALVGHRDVALPNTDFYYFNRRKCFFPVSLGTARINASSLDSCDNLLIVVKWVRDFVSTSVMWKEAWCFVPNPSEANSWYHSGRHSRRHSGWEWRSNNECFHSTTPRHKTSLHNSVTLFWRRWDDVSAPKRWPEVTTCVRCNVKDKRAAADLGDTY